MTKFKTHSLAALGLLSLVAMVFPSCTEDYFDMDTMQEDMFEWNPDLAFPLVFSSLTAADIVGYDENNYYTYGDDSFITLVYTRTVFSETLNEFLEIPATQGLNQSISLTAGEVAAFPGSGQTNHIESVQFPMLFQKPE